MTCLDSPAVPHRWKAAAGVRQWTKSYFALPTPSLLQWPEQGCGGVETVEQHSPFRCVQLAKWANLCILGGSHPRHSCSLHPKLARRGSKQAPQACKSLLLALVALFPVLACADSIFLSSQRASHFSCGTCLFCMSDSPSSAVFTSRTVRKNLSEDVG